MSPRVLCLWGTEQPWQHILEYTRCLQRGLECDTMPGIACWRNYASLACTSDILPPGS